MSVMDKIKSMMKGHPDESGKAVDQGAEYLNEKTQGKHEGQVDAARDKAKTEFGAGQDQPPPPPQDQPPPPPPPGQNPPPQ